MRYVRLNGDVVAEIGEFESIEGRFHPSLVWVQSDTGQMGDVWDGVEFSRPQKPVEAIRAEVVRRTQQRLDDFAKTRNYDGILSACTYATSTVPKFQAEGQYCVSARDATWATLYEILAEVEAGTRPVPIGYADVEADLPALVWPA